jgi:hypothetical protein
MIRLIICLCFLFCFAAVGEESDAPVNAANYEFFGIRLGTPVTDLIKQFPKAHGSTIQRGAYAVEHWVANVPMNDTGWARPHFWYSDGKLYMIELDYFDPDTFEKVPSKNELLVRLTAKFGQPVTRQYSDDGGKFYEWDIKTSVGMRMIRLLPYNYGATVEICDADVSLKIPPEKQTSPRGTGF